MSVPGQERAKELADVWSVVVGKRSSIDFYPCASPNVYLWSISPKTTSAVHSASDINRRCRLLIDLLPVLRATRTWWKRAVDERISSAATDHGQAL
jgi:hypothetical protein